MSYRDYATWARDLHDEEAEYYLYGERPPEGHPDQVAEELERLELEGRYFDAPLGAPCRVDDGWLDEDERVAA